MVRIPEISSLETAIRIYWEKIELSNKDIGELFGKVGKSKIKQLKDTAREKMAENKIPSFSAARVNTKVAYAAWGLDIEDLEKRYNKLKKLAI